MSLRVECCPDLGKRFSPSGIWTAGFILLFWTGIFFLGGCSTPFLATDNELLLRLPGTERRSDQIEGVLRPWERRKLIEEKGEKGRRASASEKELLVYQLMQEYERSTDPNIRRTAVEAVGKITETADIPAALSFYDKALRDETIGVRVSAADGLGRYALQAPKGDYRNVRARSAELLAARYRELPYSIDAGQKKENDERKDLRLAILRNLGRFEDSDPVVALLGEALSGEPLDDGALQLAAMKSLAGVTGKNYALDAELWREYVAYREGKNPAEPKELSRLTGFNPLSDLSIMK